MHNFGAGEKAGHLRNEGLERKVDESRGF